MCGICGVFGADNSQPIEKSQITRMTRAMIHRGPDDEGFHLEPGLALGMRRLSIIDLDSGQQPMQNEDGSLVLICNGEIYNYQELRKEMIGKGHRFKAVPTLRWCCTYMKPWEWNA